MSWLRTVCLFALLWSSGAGAVERAALVIGNSAYLHAPELPNPRNDARDLAAVLQRIGFEVTLGLDLNRAGFDATLRAFAQKAADAATVVFFYAGHGLQVAGENYLVPVDARLERESDLLFEAVKFSFIMQILESRPRTNLVFLDACRDNPLAENLARSLGRTRSTMIGRGLAEVSAGAGTLVAYATDPGNVALDGEGENSPFTEALLRHIETPGLEVRSMLTRVRRDVYEATGGKQRPWDNSSLLREFYFVEMPVETAVAEPQPQPAPATTPQTDPAAQARDLGELERERIFWQGIQNSTHPGDFEVYLQLYPEGMFAPLARARLERLRAMSPEERVALAAPTDPRPPTSERVIQMKSPEPGSMPAPAAVGTAPAAASAPAPAAAQSDRQMESGPEAQIAALPPKTETPAAPPRSRVPEALLGLLPVPRPAVPAKQVELAARAPETSVPPVPAPAIATPTAPAVRARELLELAGRLELQAMNRAPGEHICQYDGRFDDWTEASTETALRTPLVNRAIDQAALSLVKDGAAGAMVADVAADGSLAVLAHIVVENGSQVFTGASASAYEICDPGTARWQLWSFFAGRAEAGPRSYLRLAGFMIRFVPLGLKTPAPHSCVVFEATGRQRHWFGGYLCQPGERPLGAAELTAFLGQSRLAGVLSD